MIVEQTSSIVETADWQTEDGTVPRMDINDLKKVARIDWRKVKDRVLWRTLGEAYCLQWTAIG